MFKGKVILVVDDEIDLRDILRDELLFEGAEVAEAENGKEAWELISKRNFDVILSDIRMPGGDGAALTQKLRELHPSEPRLILITGFADLTAEDAYHLGADGYVTKPFHLNDLKLLIQRLLTPFDQRWLSDQGPARRQIVISQCFSDLVEAKKIRLGRGGLCLQMAPGAHRTGDVIEVIFPGWEPIGAQVRWTRSGLTDQSPAAIGLEFLRVPSELLPQLSLFFPGWQKEKFFIPNR